MADVYRVGVAIGMTDNASQVLGTLSRSLLGVNLQAQHLEGGLNRARVAAVGLAGVIGGGAMLSSMGHLVNAGKEFVHQQSLMLQAGLSHQEVAQATATAWQTASTVIGSSAEKNIGLVADLRNQLGTMREAVAAMPQVAQMGVVLQNLTGQDQERAGFTAIRFLDQRGSLIDPNTHEISTEHLTQQMRLLEGIATGTRGRAGPDQLLAFQQYARLAGASLSDQGLMNLAPVIAASGSASSVGTQLSSLQQQLIGGVMTSAGAHWLESMGLMDRRMVHEGRGGHLTLDPGALSGASQLQSDPVSWVRDYLIPALNQHGAVSSEAQAEALQGSHLRSTVIGLLGEVVRNLPAFQRDADNINRAVAVDQYRVAQGTDPTTRLNSFQTAWHNLMTALGAPIVNDATGMIGRLTGVITQLTNVAQAHPRAVADIELGVAGIAGLVALSGSIAVAGAALGPLASGLRLLFAALQRAPAATAATSGASAAAAATGTGLAGATSGATAVAGAAGATGAATSRAAMLRQGGAILATGALAYGADQTARDARAQIGLHDQRVARWNQWEYDHTFGMLGVDMRRYAAPVANVTQPLPNVLPPTRSPATALAVTPPPDVGRERSDQQGGSGMHGSNGCNTFVSVYLDSKQIAAQIMMRQQRDAQQQMRASGTSPDVIQHPQLPGRAIGR
ncbi:hypothetical protein [Komagataeibacter sp. SM21]|uniref:hypothetical protein n=1 Tax=Komagataeibacter sp. SM21 TaxID=3242899 RepID=UPI003528F18A